MPVAKTIQVREKVEKALDDIRPYLKSDGGDIQLLEVTSDLVVRVKLLGACETCKMSASTMKAGVESTIRIAVPEVKEVVAVN